MTLIPEIRNNDKLLRLLHRARSMTRACGTGRTAIDLLPWNGSVIDLLPGTTGTSVDLLPRNGTAINFLSRGRTAINFFLRNRTSIDLLLRSSRPTGASSS